MLSLSTALLTVSLQSSPAPASTPPQPVDPPRARIAVPLGANGGATLEDLAGLDLLGLDLGAGRATALAVPRDLARLTAAGIDFEIESADEQARYAERLLSSDPVALEGSTLAGSLVPPFGQGSMGGYWTWDEVVSVLDQLHAAFPGITTPKFSIGKTLEGRDIWALKVSDAPNVDEDEPEVRYDSMHHSREPQGMQTSFWFLIHTLETYGTDPLSTYLVDERELFFVPVVNPDGYVYNQQIAPGGGGLWRKNRRNNGDGTTGVDLNRNYPFQWGFDNFGSSPSTDSVTYRGPSPASELETQSMVQFMDQRG
ncbi:MAG: M14 family zinc carboxypeptidase, partial [Planctomycetota bacterium]